MKKLAVGASALVAAAILAASPATAITPNADGNIVCQIAINGDTYDAAQFDAHGGSYVQFTGGVDTSFAEPWAFVAVDNATNTLYYSGSGLLYKTDLLAEGDAIEIGVSSNVLGMFDTDGLAVNDLTGDVLLASQTGADFEIYKFDPAAENFAAFTTLTSSDLTDGGSFAINGGHYYVYDRATGKIVVFDATTGSQTSLIDPPPHNYTGYYASIHVTADGEIFIYSETDTGTDYGINYYNLATGTWGDNIDAVDMNSNGWGGSYATCTWWGDPEVEPTPELPNTGVDALGVTLAASMLLAAGGALTLIRRRSA